MVSGTSLAPLGSMTKSFSSIFLEPGYKVLIAHRRLFEADKPRLFVGTVEIFDSTSGLLKVTGFSFYPKKGTNWERKKELRTKIVALASGTLIVYQLPHETDLTKVEIVNEKAGLVLTDEHHLRMDLSEPV